MIFKETFLKGLFVIEPTLISDNRGFFSRTFCKKEFSKIGFEKEFVQFNHSFNLKKGTVRGMHFQISPFAETKLIRCVHGKIFDVATDLRKNSPTFLQSFGVELSEENMISVLIPDGFAHGFQTLQNNSSLIYHHTQYYTPGADSGLRSDDPALKINWPLPVECISEKDKSYALINNHFKGIEI